MVEPTRPVASLDSVDWESHCTAEHIGSTTVASTNAVSPVDPSGHPKIGRELTNLIALAPFLD